MFETEHPATDAGGGIFTRRAALIGVLQAAGLGVLGARLYQLQVLDQHAYGKIAQENRTTTQTLAPLRGRVFGRYGNVLADTEEFYQAVLTPSLAENVDAVLEVIRRIRPLADGDMQRIRRQIREGRGGGWSTASIVLASELSWAEVAAINLNAPLLPGVHTEIAGRRRYRNHAALGRIVGYVGSVEKFALDDDPAIRIPGVRIGKAGVERGLDDLLRGQGGNVVRETDARGRIIRTLAQTDPKRGQDVAITIDERLQKRLLALLSRHRRAAGVVIDIATGDVVAMAGWPHYDVSELADPISAERWRKLQKIRGTPLFDRSVQGAYPPGSTFKMVTALAALEAGVIDTAVQVTCTGTYTLANTKFRCWNRSGHGPSNLHRALRESCDVYFYEVARRVGITRLAEMARKLGFGESHEIGISPVSAGLMPDPEWKRGRYGSGWFAGETLHAGIGQGYVLATPLQMAVMTARIASGRALAPTVVRPALAAAGAAKPLDIHRAHLDAVRRGMWAVVNEAAGTGNKARLGDQSLQIFGKTGTSQVARLSRVASSSRWDLQDHALFVGYIADRKPRYAIAAIVEHGGSGGKVAAPLVREIAEAVIAIDPAARAVFDASQGHAARAKRS